MRNFFLSYGCLQSCRGFEVAEIDILNVSRESYADQICGCFKLPIGVGGEPWPKRNLVQLLQDFPNF